MSYMTSSEYVTQLDEAVVHMESSSYKVTCIFCNSGEMSHIYLKELECKINVIDTLADVINVHGKLEKNEMFWFIHTFCATISLPDLVAKILLATSASNVGI